MAKRIIILSGIQLSTNPRVVKEADALAAAGYDVVVLGATLNPALAARDRALVAGRSWKYEVLLDAAGNGIRNASKWFYARARLRVWRELRRRIGVSGFRQLGYAGREMLSYCLVHSADLYIVHNPQSTWVGRELIARGLPVAADFEDWYSEDLLPADRAYVPTEFLRECERAVLQAALYSTTTSHAMSDALTAAFDCASPFVVYNSFPATEGAAVDGLVLDRSDLSLPSVIWFSQVAGPGRGLETLIDSLKHLRTPMAIHIRGNCEDGYREELMARAPDEWRDRIVFHSQVPHADLPSRLAEHDVGFAGDLPLSQSRNLTITNKILQYMLAGLPVVASDTKGHREVASRSPAAVSLFEAGNPKSLAETLEKVVADRSALSVARASATASTEEALSWEKSAQRLVSAVRGAIGS